METTPGQPADTRPSLTPAEVARELGISLSKTYDLLSEGSIPSFKVGSARRVRRSDLDAYVEEKIKYGERQE